ncbi:MAG: 50S ribosomal protein L11 methyltransferase, partial [Rickettsiales bacterium]
MTAFPSSENPLYDLELEAGADAFGDGSHPSTNSALQVMQGLSQHVTFERILDMGSGAGLLAMASALFWPDANVLGADIQESAVALA